MLKDFLNFFGKNLFEKLKNTPTPDNKLIYQADTIIYQIYKKFESLIQKFTRKISNARAFPNLNGNLSDTTSENC